METKCLMWINTNGQGDAGVVPPTPLLQATVGGNNTLGGDRAQHSGLWF